MNTLCVHCQVHPWPQERTQVTVLVLVVIILVIAAAEGWTLAANVAAVISAVSAVSASTGHHKAAL